MTEDENPRITTLAQLKEMTPHEIVAAKEKGLIDFEALGNDRREQDERAREAARAAHGL